MKPCLITPRMANPGVIPMILSMKGEHSQVLNYACLWELLMVLTIKCHDRAKQGIYFQFQVKLKKTLHVREPDALCDEY